MQVCNYFTTAREAQGFNPSYVVDLSGIPTSETVNDIVTNEILSQVKAKITSIGLGKIDYIVTTYGVPLIDYPEPSCSGEGGVSIDALLANNLTDFNICSVIPGYSVYATSPYGLPSNPYAGAISSYTTQSALQNSEFSYNKYHIYEVTRLDGPTLNSIYNLIKNAGKAGSASGYILFNPYTTASNIQNVLPFFEISYAEQYLESINVKYQEVDTSFVTGVGGLSGYLSTGSNCGCTAGQNSSTWNLGFVPGAVGETLVSTSARTLIQYPWTGGQSLISDLVMDNITGVIGAVSEPWSSAFDPATSLFDSYFSGFNLADSFYDGQSNLAWKITIIGDPKAHITSLTSVEFTTSISPTSVVLNPGQSTTFTSTVSDIRFSEYGYTYQWYSGNSPTCADDTAISGATSSTYTYTAISPYKKYICLGVTDGSLQVTFSPTTSITVQ